MIEVALYNLLSNEASISGLVANRIYPLLLPTEAVMPSITYQFIGGSTKPSLTTTGLQEPRVQIDCWGTDYLTAASVRAAVVTFLNLKRGPLVDGLYLQAAIYNQPIDYFSSGGEIFRCGADFTLQYHLLA